MTDERVDHWIAGKAHPPSNRRYLPTIDPATRAPGPQVADGSAVDIHDAVASAAAAQPSWARCSAGDRSDVLHSIAAVIEARADELMDAERLSTGKPAAQLRMEIDMSAAYFRYYAGAIRSQHGRIIDLGEGSHTYTRIEPYGVVAVITPWNLPLNQACRAAAPALAVGNAVVAKPSEFTSLSTLLLAQFADEAGLPDGLLNVVTGTGGSAGAALVAHPGVCRIAFTGSVAAGRSIAAAAGDRLIPATVELGGKSPIVIFADADLDGAAAAAAGAIVTNAGQVCSATTRIVAEAAIHDALVDRIVEAVASLEPATDFGPIITQTQYEKVLAVLSEAVAMGHIPRVGGHAYICGPGAAGQYVQPTVFTDVPRDSPLMREEIFGPVLVTTRVEGEEEAVAVANDTDYGLAGSVWSGDLARAVRVAHRIEAGQVSVNGGPLNIETPFGGFKQSGYGREKGLEALDEYSQVKCVSVSLGMTAGTGR